VFSREKKLCIRRVCTAGLSEFNISRKEKKRTRFADNEKAKISSAIGSYYQPEIVLDR